MKENKTTPFDFDNTEAWGTDSFYVLGILGFFLYVLLGLTSLPSVGGSLSWREFSFIQVQSFKRLFSFTAPDVISSCLPPLTLSGPFRSSTFGVSKFSSELLKRCRSDARQAGVSPEPR